MATSLEIAVRARDQASQVMERVGESGSRAGQLIEDHWAKATAAAAGLALGVESLARKHAPLREASRRLAAATGESESAMRDLARSTSNVTFPLDEVLALMEAGRTQGIMTGEELQRFAQFWDMVGDATGESGVALGEAGVALRAVGIAAGEEEQALAAFGFVTQETSGNVREFLQFLERTGPELRELGLDVDDAAGLMGVLEGELGLTARTARQEFRRAVNEADGDLSTMLETLGVSSAQFDTYRQKVDESSGVIERNAEIHADSFTTLQRMQHWLSELTFGFGGVITGAANLAPLMLALPPILRAVTAGKRAAAAATVLLNRALTVLARHPVLAAVGAITALVAAYSAFRQGSKLNEQAVQELSKAMREQNDIVGDNTRAWLESALNDAGDIGRELIDRMVEAGLTLEDLEEAVAGGDEGIAGLKERMEEAGVSTRDLGEWNQDLTDVLGSLNDHWEESARRAEADTKFKDENTEATKANAVAVGEARFAVEELTSDLGPLEGALDDIEQAQRDAEGATRGHIEAIIAQNSLLDRTFGPLAQFRRATERVEEAQRAHTEAVEAHGPKSDEATEASWELLEAVLAQEGALGELMEQMGETEEEMIAGLKMIASEAGLSEEATEGLVESVRELLEEGDAIGERRWRADLDVNVNRAEFDRLNRELAQSPRFAMAIGPGGAVPVSHPGSIFHAPIAGGEGLAVLRDQQRVLPPGAQVRGGDGSVSVDAPVSITIHGAQDPEAVRREVQRELDRWQRDLVAELGAL